ncbi:tetratricopeptide repeat protein [Geitlerinema sp. PCC 9228]|jgi:tetratricopeptide (TPR) repeat protein|uniref:tetratricopeptide repeat protein n=1 Tax=Geitlerinema sp. PCC 9228 TaxID=111611 RepID=UPI0008F98DC0|nr:tetratricopeptide repeat protein [Geitlerinema sp. PCC 9228]
MKRSLVGYTVAATWFLGMGWLAGQTPMLAVEKHSVAQSDAETLPSVEDVENSPETSEGNETEVPNERQMPVNEELPESQNLENPANPSQNDAETNYRDAPSSPNWIQRGHQQMKQGRYQAAVMAYDRVLQNNPESASIWVYRGTALEQLQEYEKALDSHQEAIAIEPSYSAAWYGRGISLLYLSRYESALTAFERALNGDGNWENRSQADALNNKGVALWHLQRHEEALQAYQQALEMNPDHALAQENLTKLQRQMEREQASTSE